MDTDSQDRPAAAHGARLGIDLGTSHTVAVLARPDGRTDALLFDSSPLLPSAVFVGADGEVLTGADATRAAGAHPAGLEPSPKLRVDDDSVWLGERAVPVVELLGAVLGRVGAEARRVAGADPVATVLTYPAGWSRSRLAVLAAAARRAGLGEVGLVREPVAAAAYFASVLGLRLPVGQCLVVYDFGAGTFDVSVVRMLGTGVDVIAADGLTDTGGNDLDAVMVDLLRTATPAAAEAWGRLEWPTTPADLRARRTLWLDARAAKEQLTRHAHADVHIPIADVEGHVTREEFERAARALLDRTVALTAATLRAAGVRRDAIGGVLLVGGSSRIPLAANLLHRTLGIAPTVIEQPELVVAYGSLHTAAETAATALPYLPEPTRSAPSVQFSTLVGDRPSQPVAPDPVPATATAAPLPPPAPSEPVPPTVAAAPIAPLTPPAPADPAPEPAPAPASAEPAGPAPEHRPSDGIAEPPQPPQGPTVTGRIRRNRWMVAGIAATAAAALVTTLVLTRPDDGSQTPTPAEGPVTRVGVEGVAVGPDGAVYFAVRHNIALDYDYQIRKIDPSGQLSTIAGTSTAGFSGDGSPATTAQLRNAQGVAVGADGSVYIADSSNHRIRKVDPSAQIHTIAGDGTGGFFSGENKVATTAWLALPIGVAVGADGSVYIADSVNQRIRKVDTAGKISTIAGKGTMATASLDAFVGLGTFSGDNGSATSAELSHPDGVAVGADGTVYIADTGNHRIRKVDRSGTISTIAGSGSGGMDGGGFSGDGGLATAAQLDRPDAVAVGADGTVYIADNGNHRIRKVDQSGRISTIAGTGTEGFSGDGGLATAAQLHSPQGVAVAADGTVYIADTDNGRLRKIDTSGLISSLGP